MPGVFWPMMVAGTYMFLTSLEGQVITPYFVSRRLQMNTVVVFLAVALWAWLWSVIGMIIAVPVLVVLRVLAEYVPGWEKFGNFRQALTGALFPDNRKTFQAAWKKYCSVVWDAECVRRHTGADLAIRKTR